MRFYFEEHDEDSLFDYETLLADFSELVGEILPDAKGLLHDMVDEGAYILQECYEKYLRKNHFVSGKLVDSIGYTISVNEAKRMVAALVGPVGRHHGVNTSTKGTHRSKTGQGKSYSRKHHGMKKGVSAQEVGFFLEFGTPRIKATHWMEKANEIAEEKIFAAQEAIYDKYLKLFFEKHNK